MGKRKRLGQPSACDAFQSISEYEGVIFFWRLRRKTGCSGRGRSQNGRVGSHDIHGPRAAFEIAKSCDCRTVNIRSFASISLSYFRSQLSHQ